MSDREIIETTEPVTETPKPPSYEHLMSEMKRQVKRLSHNELARNFVNLFAQHILLKREMEVFINKINAENRNNETNAVDSSNETGEKSE